MIIAAATTALLLCEAAAGKGAAPLAVLQLEEAVLLQKAGMHVESSGERPACMPWAR